MTASIDLVSIADERAKTLRKLAKQCDEVKWSTAAVLRENASLILTMAARIRELEAVLPSGEKKPQ